MNLKKAKNFVNEICSVPVEIVSEHLDEGCYAKAAVCWKSELKTHVIVAGRIVLNKKHYSMNDNMWKAVLLHEVGHISTQGWKDCVSDMELKAHLWAIDKTKELCLEEEISTCLYLMLVEWGSFDWNTHRVFRIAYKKILSDPVLMDKYIWSEIKEK